MGEISRPTTRSSGRGTIVLACIRRDRMTRKVAQENSVIVGRSQISAVARVAKAGFRVA